MDAFATKLAIDDAEGAKWQGKRSSAATRFVETGIRGNHKPMRREYENDPPLRFLLVCEPTTPGSHLDGTTTTAKPTISTDPSLTSSAPLKYWLTFELTSGELDIRASKGGAKVTGINTLVRKGRLPKSLVSMGPTEIGAISSINDDAPVPVEFYGEDDLIVGALERTIA